MKKIKFTKEDWEAIEYLDLSLLVCLYSNKSGEPTFDWDYAVYALLWLGAISLLFSFFVAL